MTTKAEVIALHLKHPDWSSIRIAEALGCDDGYVRKTFHRNGLQFLRTESELISDQKRRESMLARCAA